jgi:AraC-like DNA-binding protein
VRPTVALNRHDYCEIFYVSAGRLRFHIHGSSVLMRAGDLALVGKNYYHTFAVPLGSSPTVSARGISMFFRDTMLSAQASSEEAELLAPFLTASREHVSVIRQKTGVPRRVLALMKEIARALQAPTARTAIAVRALLRMALVRLLEHRAVLAPDLDRVRQQRADLERLDAVFSLLASRGRDIPSLGDAARAASMSRSKFIRVFRRTTGKIFVTYVNDYRIARAQELLATSDKTAAEIAQEVGFAGQSYFGQVFRHAVGLTPVAYRHATARARSGKRPRSGEHPHRIR